MLLTLNYIWSNSQQNHRCSYEQWQGSKSRSNQSPMHWIWDKEPGTHQWSHYSKASPCWHRIPTVAATSPVVLTQKGSTSSQAWGNNPQYNPVFPKLPIAVWPLFKDRGSDYWYLFMEEVRYSAKQHVKVFRFWTFSLGGLEDCTCFVASKLQQLGSWELHWALAISAGPNRRQLMLLHRQQQQPLPQLSSCCAAVLWRVIKHSLPEGRILHWTWKWDRCQIPVQGQCLGNQAMWCSEHRCCQYLFPHGKQSELFFS